MSDSATLTLPVLPLRNGVVFPGMVVTIALESSEARRAVAAAQDGSGRVLLVPRIDGEYAKVGTIAALEQVENTGSVRGALVRGLARARVGAGQIGDAAPSWWRSRSSTSLSSRTRSRSQRWPPSTAPSSAPSSNTAGLPPWRSGCWRWTIQVSWPTSPPTRPT